MPFGLAVVPDVYSVKSRSSLSIASGSHVAGWSATRSWYQWSRPSVMGTSLPVRRTTTTVRMVSRLGQRLVDVALQRHGGAAAPCLVLGDQAHRPGVVHAVGHGVGGEAAEHHRVGGADARAGEHRHRQLGDHAHVDADAVAALDAEAAQRVGEPAHLLEQLGVRDGAGVAGLALPQVRDLVAAAGLDVPVEALVARVQRAADEPAREGKVPVEDGVPRAARSSGTSPPAWPRTPPDPPRPRATGCRHGRSPAR